MLHKDWVTPVHAVLLIQTVFSEEKPQWHPCEKHETLRKLISTTTEWGLPSLIKENALFETPEANSSSYKKSTVSQVTSLKNPKTSCTPFFFF